MSPMRRRRWLAHTPGHPEARKPRPVCGRLLLLRAVERIDRVALTDGTCLFLIESANLPPKHPMVLAAAVERDALQAGAAASDTSVWLPPERAHGIWLELGGITREAETLRGLTRPRDRPISATTIEHSTHRPRRTGPMRCPCGWSAEPPTEHHDELCQATDHDDEPCQVTGRSGGRQMGRPADVHVAVTQRANSATRARARSTWGLSSGSASRHSSMNWR